jgi:hypothetical protein
MIAFLKRLAGVHPEQIAVDERFHENLNGMAQKNRELEELRDQLRFILVKARDTGVDLQYTISSHMSGEHQLQPSPAGPAGTAPDGRDHEE